MNPGWALAFLGWPWWSVVPLAAIAGWGVVTLAKPELTNLPRRTAVGLRMLRVGSVVAVVLLLLEPALTRTTFEREPPMVAIIIDRSGSMVLDDRGRPATAQLDELRALGMLREELRPDAGRRLAIALLALGEALPSIAHDVGSGNGRAIQEIDLHLAAIVVARGTAAAMVERTEAIDAIVVALQKAKEALTGAPEQRTAAADALAGLQDRVRDLATAAEVAQHAGDNALVAGADQGSPVAEALRRLAGLDRWQRALAIVRASLLPNLERTAQVECFALDGDGGVVRIDPRSGGQSLPDGGTDLAAPLQWISRTWSSRHVGAVIYVGDGRRTTGDDPVPVARALAARGARVDAVMIGAVEAPRDAAIAFLSGPGESYRGESLHVDARWRVSGYVDRAFDLVLALGGAEIERRVVRGDGTWKTDRFTIPAEALARVAGGVAVLDATIEPSRRLPADSPIQPGGGLLREVWLGVPGDKIADFFDEGNAPRRPEEQEGLATATWRDVRENLATRVRGWIIPPETGEYTFWASGDDETELWLGHSGTPYDRQRLARVPEWTQPDEWDKYAAQHSEAIHLEAGRPVYLEILHKQGVGGSHLSVGWQLPSNRVERPIGGAVLAPWRDGLAPTPADDAERPEASVTNNQAELAVAISDDPLRVLVLDQQPRWETRFLAALFERDRRVEVVRRFRSLLLPRREQMLTGEADEFDDFDVVVLGDLAPGELSAEDQERLVRFVGSRGGFLIAIAGRRGMPWGFSLGGLADLLPIRAVGRPSGEGSSLVLTADGLDHPMMRILDDPQANRKLWAGLPSLGWIASAVVAKPSAKVLLASADPTAAPVVAANQVGAGRVLWVGSDETWRWRDPLGDLVHQAFWLQAVRWGLGDRLRGRDPRLRVGTDRVLIDPKGGIELRARTDGRTTGDGPPVAVVERMEGGERRKIAFTHAEDAELWTGWVQGLDEGRWRITVEVHTAEGTLSEMREVVVRRPQGIEGVELGTDRDGLVRLTAAGGGETVGIDGAMRLASRISAGMEPRTTERRTLISLWSGPWALMALLVLLTSEWIWRKRRGLP